MSTVKSEQHVSDKIDQKADSIARQSLTDSSHILNDITDSLSSMSFPQRQRFFHRLAQDASTASGHELPGLCITTNVSDHLIVASGQTMLYNESSSGVAENDGRGNTHFTELDQLTGKVAGTIDTTREMDGSTKIERNVYRDAHGRVARTTEDSYWNSGFRSITWNAAGNRIEQTHSDSAGNTEKIKYDSHGRISGTVNTISIVNGNDVTERTVARDGHGKLNYSMEELLPASGLYQTHVWNGSGNMVQEYRRHADGTSEETRYRHNVSVTFNFDKNHQRIS